MRKPLTAAGVLLIAGGVLIAVTGGLNFRIAGVPLRARDPIRALGAGVALLLFVSAVYRRDSAALADDVLRQLRRAAPALALALGLGLGIHAIAFGAFTAGGSDSFGYVNQAYDWAAGVLPRPQPVAVSLPFPSSDDMQAPLGYRVGPSPHTIVPTYAPGLPLMMAVALAVGPCGPFLVVPLFAVMFVWFTYRLGALAAGRLTGVAAALVLATTPVVLFQAVWPMSDIPAGALWTAALVYALQPSRRSTVAAGLLTALGLLVRPNLLFVAGAPLVMILASVRGRERAIRTALFGLPVAFVAVLIAVLNTMWYGSPSNSGYGAAHDLYVAANVWPNLKRYGSWLRASQGLWPLLALVPLVPGIGRMISRRVAVACVLIIALTVASYASYFQFEEWWYLRFLLPAFGALAVLIAAGVVAIARRVPRPAGSLVAAVALSLVVWTTISFAAAQAIFGGVRANEHRYLDVARFAAAHLPSNAALFAVQHSGSLRFYTGRLTLRFDAVEKSWAADVPTGVERAGYHPYLIVDDWELAQVRTQFGMAEGVGLPWPIVARMRELGGVTVFDLATQAKAGDPVALEPGADRRCESRSRPST